MIKNLFTSTWQFIVAVVESIPEGRKLRAEMTTGSHGVAFDKNGNVVPRSLNRP